jgi:uncharacterized surface protein with fasciclin (FAS1) repeats
MSFFIRIAFFIAIASVIFSCKKKFDDYYERPNNLDPAIYKQLESMGKFSTLLSLIDKAGYKQTLSSAGYWTLFAPTDSAIQADNDFRNYLQSRNINSIEAIDSATAQAIVQYLLVFNGFNRDRLDDYQSNIGWVPDIAFKRRTAYYTGFYKDTTANSQIVTAIQSNRNNVGNAGYYISADNNNKYIPFFTIEFLSAKGLTPSDYTYFYPNTPFSGFNVANAKVTRQNISAENGVIHILDHVVTPLPSLDQYIRTKPEYSEMKGLFNQLMVQFLQNADASHRYQVLSGNNAENVYVKVYSFLLGFSPNNENYFKQQDNDGQREGWTLVVPRNDSLQSYIKRVLLESYPSVSALPVSVITDLLNAHMWQTSVWPSRFKTTLNYLGEPLYSDPQTDIIEKKILSNGILYGTTKVNEPNVFSTVYGKAYLNPKYSLMTRLLDQELRTVISNPNANYTVFMISDAVLSSQGFGYDPANNIWYLGSVKNDSIRLNLTRILNESVVETPHGELDGLGTAGFKAVMSTYGGEVLKFDGNKIITAGTLERGITVTIDSVKTARNGRVIYLNNLLYFPYVPMGKKLEALGAPTTSKYNYFWNYLKNSTAYDAVNNTINGTSAGSFYTIFVPDSAAICQAIADGLLPGTPAAPNFNPTSTPDKVLVEKFIQYHVIDKRTVIPDGKDTGGFLTLYKNIVGDVVQISIEYPGNVFEITDAFGRKAHIVPGFANELSNRTVIHLIDNYLKYTN